jgi:hypothetical protein
MPNNLSERIREWDEQAVQCARQADTQTDPKVKQQFLELKRLWLLLARSYDLLNVWVTARQTGNRITFRVRYDAKRGQAGHASGPRGCIEFERRRALSKTGGRLPTDGRQGYQPSGQRGVAEVSRGLAKAGR